MSRLAGAHAVVTGGSSGIGLATARRLRAAGARVTVVARDPQRLDRAAAGMSATPRVADLADAADLADLAGELRSQVPDVLVLAAGTGLAEAAERTGVGTTRALLALNVEAPMALTAAVLPGMRRRGGGHLVFVGSVAGALGVAGESVYAASKAALETYAASVDAEVRRHGIRVTTLVPGVVDTAFFARRGAPYARRFPRPVAAELVAERLVDAIEHDRREVVVPRWLRLPIAVRALAPGSYARAAGRWG